MVAYSRYAYQEKEGKSHTRNTNPRQGYWVSRGPSCCFEQAHRRIGRTPKEEPKGQTLTTRTLANGSRQTHSSFVFKEKQRKKIQRSSKEARAEVKEGDSPFFFFDKVNITSRNIFIKEFSSAIFISFYIF